MIEYVKEQLLENFDCLKELLEHYGYRHIKEHNTYISFARNDESSPKSIVINKKNNKYLYVTDYPKNISCDLFKYIISQKNVEFRDVISKAKEVLGISEFYSESKYEAFGGIYNRIKQKKELEVKVYENSLLDQYDMCGNKMFLKDGISLEAQRFFNVGFDKKRDAISIPIYNEFGELIGIKERINREPREYEDKYYYDIPCLMSQTLYGYSQNYEFLQGNSIYIFESEKSVMQLYDMGYRNGVALGSSSISNKQVKLLLMLDPKELILMFDKDLKPEAIENNVKMIKSYSRMKEVKIKYWKPSEDIPDKASATDLGKEQFDIVIKNQIMNYD